MESRSLSQNKNPPWLAAANIVAPTIAKALEDQGCEVIRTSGADTAAWRRIAQVPKSHAIDAACTASGGQAIRWAGGTPHRITMTGRGSHLVVRRNASGFPRLKKDGSTYAAHRSIPPHGIRCADVVRIDKAGRGARRRVGTVTTARHDGRCEIALRSGDKVKVRASRLAVIHRSVGALVQ